MNILANKFLYSVVTSSPFCVTHPVLKKLQLYSPFIVTDQISHQYKPTGNIIVLCTLTSEFLETRWENKRF
jgi:hypothetical protein